MSKRAALDPDAARLLASWMERSPIPVHEQSLEQSRNSGLVGPDIIGTPPEVCSVIDGTVPGSVDVPVRIYRPSTAEGLPVMVYAHGGGWTLLSIDSVDVLCRHIASRADCVVVSVGYRLAPEHPFPAAFDDVWDVAAWISAGGLGWIPACLALGGDSAGGNLSAGVSTHARDTGAMRIDFQLLLYPALGLDLETPSMLELGPDPRFRLTPDSMRWFWSNYLGGDVTSDDPRAVPMMTDDFSGLPETLLVTAAYDPLRDDGARYGEALRAAGVVVDHVDLPALPHGFTMMIGVVPAAQAALDGVLTKVAAALHRRVADQPDSSLPALAREFKQRPFGRHSEPLQVLLHQMRSQPVGGKPFLFMSESQREWVLGRYTDEPPYRPIVDWSVIFNDLEAAEWHVFKARWRDLFDEDLGDD